jgi:hypothetical protein
MNCLLVCLAAFLGTSAAVEGPNRYHLSQFGFSSAPLEMGTQGLRGANVDTLALSNGWGMLSFYDNNKCTGKASLSYLEAYGTCFPSDQDGEWEKSSYQIIKKGNSMNGKDVHTDSLPANAVGVNFFRKHYSDNMCMMQMGVDKEELPAKCTKVAVGGYAIDRHYDTLPNQPTGGVVMT